VLPCCVFIPILWCEQSLSFHSKYSILRLSTFVKYIIHEKRFDPSHHLCSIIFSAESELRAVVTFVCEVGDERSRLPHHHRYCREDE
jgi:hypothetical protein